MKKFVLMLGALLFMTACGGGGGGGDSSSTANPAQGLWEGTTNTNRNATGIILSDGTGYFLYTERFSDSTIAGVVQGKIDANNGTFSSNNAKDFNFGDDIGVVNVALTGAYTAKNNLTGVAVYGGSLGSTTFTTTYSSNYELTPSLATIAGNYSGQVVTSAGIENAATSISTTGVFYALGSSGCVANGSFTPRTDGNAYNTSITFGGSPCLFANQNFSGISYYDGTTRTLYSAAPNASRTDGILFVGTK